MEDTANPKLTFRGAINIPLGHSGELKKRRELRLSARNWTFILIDDEAIIVYKMGKLDKEEEEDIWVEQSTS
uniref:Uncharacterized protein n=1 Tax=Rhizophora mucronata TaxID=61149 RepID=A0A2P2NFS1_RHIMU